MKTWICTSFALVTCISPAFATVTVSTPTPGTTVASPVHYVASASTTTCATGVASMGIYVNNKLIYVVNSTQLNTSITMAAGPEHTVVEEWDHCGGATFTTVDLTVGTAPATTVTITANPTTITAGSSSTLTVTATNSTQTTIAGSDGTVYHLAVNGGTQSVTPTATTTYTAEVSGSTGSASATSTVTVIPATGVNAITHVLFMLQENHTFDDYFGMLNPYRKANGWNIGADGKDYEVDGIDDKLTTISNQDDQGTSYPLFKLRTTCIDDESSSWLESYGDVNRWDFSTTRKINMDGFVHIAEGYANSCANSKTCSGSYTDLTGERAMGYYDQGFLNYYYYMASQFAVSDRWFSPVSTKSIPNRIATFTGGTTQGLVFDPGSDDHLPQLNLPNIFQELDAAKVTWKVYYTVTQNLCLASNPCPNSTASGVYPATTFSSLAYSYQYLYENPSHAACTGTTKASSVVGDSTNSFCIDPNHVAPLSQYYTDLTNNTLPAFGFIESGSGQNDEHPGSGQSILTGQTQVANIVAALTKSSSWKNSAFFLSYDEGGGPYDHVPPVPGYSNQNTDASLGTIPDIKSIAVNPDSYKPCFPSGAATLHCDLVANDPGTKSTDAAAVNGFAAQIGFRVPNIVISPFTRKHYVSHTPMDHTAIIKFVESRFLGSSTHLTARDAAQSNLLEFFDFTNIPWATPPAPPTPVSPATLGYDPCTPTSMGP
ncbi:MAG TPA: alkaline phosphatase family protein [Terracidiphilus sp.]|jgi:phospholipase C